MMNRNEESRGREGKKSGRSWSKWIGIALMILSFGFILREILQMDLSSLRIEHPLKAAVLSLLFTVLTAASVILSAYAWRNILSAIHEQTIGFGEVFKVYVKANIAKYLPGNVMHYAGRNMLGGRMGWGQGDILLSSVLEILMILLSAAVFLVLFAHRQFLGVMKDAIRNAASRPILSIAILAVLLVVAAGIFYLFRKRRDLLEKLKLLFTPKFLKVLILNFFLYTATFLIQGIVMAFILTGIFYVSPGPENIAAVISSSVLSWFAGFITPGAPGGIGVKEAVLLWTLSPVYGKEVTLAAALVHRFVSVLADVAAFGVGLIMEKRR